MKDIESKKYCFNCNKKFFDGEIVSVTKDNKAYHKPIEFRGEGLLSIYYKGKFYNLKKISNLKSIRKLKLIPNKKGTGDMIIGNLECLIC